MLVCQMGSGERFCFINEDVTSDFVLFGAWCSFYGWTAMRNAAIRNTAECF